MSTIKQFCADNNILTDEDGIHFLDECGTLLGFMHEFSFPYTEENYCYIKALHNGTSPELDYWKESRAEHKWIDSLQSIKTFPSYAVLMEFKEKIEAVIREWLVAR